MIDGTCAEARWVKPEPRRELAGEQLERILRAASLSGRVLHIEPLTDGLRNANFKLRLDGADEVFVLRLYEHDASICQKEVDLIAAIAGTTPVPEIVYAQPSGLEDLPPFAIFRFVEGPSFRELKRRGDGAAIAQAARSVGETLGRIAQVEFTQPGWLGPGLKIAPQQHQDADRIPRFIDSCLASANMQRRMDERLRERTRETFWNWAPRLRTLSAESRLVHGDFGKRNLLMRCVDGNWTVAAVLDWEFACSGSPLADVGEFLRYEDAAASLIESNFVQGMRSAAAELPDDWRWLARLIDTAKLCDSLTRDYLPEEFVPELLGLIRAATDAYGRKLNKP
jgi:aminoglycoside phosphotransferase (APT) family kinase protein